MPYDRAGYIGNCGGFNNYGCGGQNAGYGCLNDCTLLKKELHYVETYAKNRNADCGYYNNNNCYGNCGYGCGNSGYYDGGYGCGPCGGGCGPIITPPCPPVFNGGCGPCGGGFYDGGCPFGYDDKKIHRKEKKHKKDKDHKPHNEFCVKPCYKPKCHKPKCEKCDCKSCKKSIDKIYY